MDSSETSSLKIWNTIFDVRSKMGVRNVFGAVDTAIDIFDIFIEYGDDFYDHYTFVDEDGKLADDSDEMANNSIRTTVSKLYLAIPALFIYLGKQEPEYVEYVKDELLAPVMQKLPGLINIDKQTRHKIYTFELNDLINDIYLTLKYVSSVFEKFDEMIDAGGDVIEILRGNDSYSRISLCGKEEGAYFTHYEEIRKEFQAMRQNMEEAMIGFRSLAMERDKLTWLGTSTELAYLFEQLAYRGYVENPQTKDGGMNKTGLARAVWDHIAPADVKEETFIVDLRGSRLSENSTFAKAINSIPTNSKQDKRN